MNEKQKSMSVFEQIKSGLEDSIAYSRGVLSLVTTDLPDPPPEAQPEQIKALRRSFQMSQAVFAAVVNVSPKTVQSWEQGIRSPSDAALRMLQVISVTPQVVDNILGVRGSGPEKTAFRMKRTVKGRRMVTHRRTPKEQETVV